MLSNKNTFCDNLHVQNKLIKTEMVVLRVMRVADSRKFVKLALTVFRTLLPEAFCLLDRRVVKCGTRLTSTGIIRARSMVILLNHVLQVPQVYW